MDTLVAPARHFPQVTVRYWLTPVAYRPSCRCGWAHLHAYTDRDKALRLSREHVSSHDS